MAENAHQLAAFAVRRIAAGLSLAEVAGEYGVSMNRAWKWEKGEEPVPGHIAHSLAILEEFGQGSRPSCTGVSLPSDTAPTLIKSKKRVVDHGEVFTPPWLVEKMLDLVKGETERIDSRFLEPACGSGNFLVPILQRKLAAVEAKYGKAEFEKRHYALVALASLYGIELLADNIAECRANMLDVFAQYLGLTEDDDLYRTASHFLSTNLIQGDAMTMKDADGGPITVVEWSYIGKGKFNRRDFRLDVLTEMSSLREEHSLFAGLGNHEIFKPTKSYPLMTVRELAALDRGEAQA